MKNEELQTKVIIVDSNAWNFLFESNIDLFSSTFEKFRFAITWMIEKEMEYLFGKVEKRELLEYYCKYRPSMDCMNKRFGFYSENPPGGIQRYVGFGQGQFVPEKESELLIDKLHYIGSIKKTLLFNNETDLDQASKAFGRIYILTKDFKKNGPLKGITNIIKIPDRRLSEIELLELLDKKYD